MMDERYHEPTHMLSYFGAKTLISILSAEDTLLRSR